MDGALSILNVDPDIKLKVPQQNLQFDNTVVRAILGYLYEQLRLKIVKGKLYLFLEGQLLCQLLYFELSWHQILEKSTIIWCKF